MEETKSCTEIVSVFVQSTDVSLRPSEFHISISVQLLSVTVSYQRRQGSYQSLCEPGCSVNELDGKV